MTDVICGFSGGYDWPKLEPWVRSIKETGFTGRIVVVFGSGSAQTVETLRSNGVEVLTFDFDAKRNCYFIDHKARRMMDYLPERGYRRLRYRARRWLVETFSRREKPHDFRFRLTAMALRDYAIASGQDFRFLTVTDIRDVIFQRNPAAWLEANLPPQKDLIVGEEPCDYTDRWNRDNFLLAFGSDLFKRVADKRVINCGVIAGRFIPVVDVLFADYLVNTVRRTTDQSTLNLIMSFSAWRDKTLITNVEGDWVIHASTLQGDQEQMKIAKYKNGAAIAPSGEPYVVFHQYDRIKGSREMVAAKYRNDQ